jgi:glycerophosphoryl diester phosphodiesterase
MNKESIKRKLRIIKRKKWPIALIAVILVVAIALPVTISLVSSQKRLNAKTPLPLTDILTQEKDRERITLVAHRGYSAQAPENTIPAIQKAAEYGFDYVEIDIRQTKDGVWVLMHDEDIKRTTDGKGKVSELTYKQVVGCNIDKNCKEYDKVKIPSLDEMLSRCGTLGLHPVIEIKQSGTECIEELMNFLGYRTSECTIIAFDREQVELINKLMKDATTSLTSARVELYWLTRDLSDETLETAKADTSIGVSFNGNKAGKPEEIKKFTDAGIKLATWTIDKPARLAELYSLGITTFTTNQITPDGIFNDPAQEVTTNARG